MKTVAGLVLAHLVCAAAAHAELAWTAHAAGTPPPADAVVLEVRNKVPLVLARITRSDGGVHPAVAAGDMASMPFRGGVETSAVFDLATGQAFWVGAAEWDRATVLCRQSHSDVFLCRAPVRLGPASIGWAYGKAYRSGPHGGRAYLACDGREIELREGFELLRVAAAP